MGCLLGDGRLITPRGFGYTHSTRTTLLLLADVPAKVVSECLGHSNIKLTLDISSHVLSTMQRRAADQMGQRLVRTAKNGGTGVVTTPKCLKFKVDNTFGPIAQRQSTGLIIPWLQVRILLGPMTYDDSSCLSLNSPSIDYPGFAFLSTSGTCRLATAASICRDMLMYFCVVR
jgi:hypothetical protein